MRSIRFAGAVLVAVMAFGGDALAATPAEQQLAERHAPVVVLKKQTELCGSGEGFRPVLVDLVLGRSDVSLFRGLGARYERVLRAPESRQLARRGFEHYVDLPGHPVTGRCAYQRWFRRIGAQAPTAIYAHVATEAERPGQLALQYWLYYVYNDFNDKHESDWEMIQLHFDASSAAEALEREPVEVRYSQHLGAGGSSWDGGALQRAGPRPVVHVGEGSHANYFRPGIWLGRNTNEALGCDDATGPSTRLRPQVVVVPTDVDPRDARLGWLAYQGHWGQRERAFNNGPTGPNTKQQWAQPFTWADTVLLNKSHTVGDTTVSGLAASEVFCSSVTAFSEVLDAFYASRTLVLSVVGLLLALLVAAALLTRWHPAPLRPLEQRRSAGQVIRVSLRVFRLDWRTFAAVSLLVLPVAIAAAVAASAFLELGPVGRAVNALGREAHLTVHVEIFLTIAIQVAALALAVAATTIVVSSLRLGEQRIATRTSYVLIGRHAAPLAGVLLRVAGIPLALTLTVVGIPFALWYLGRTAVAVPACVIEGLDARRSIRRSVELVHGSLGRVSALVGILVLIALLVGPLIGAVVLLKTDLSPLLANAIGSLVSAGLMPVAGIVLALLFFDLRARRGNPAAAAP